MRRQHVVLVQRGPGRTPLVVGPYFRRSRALRVAAHFRIERNDSSVHAVRVVPIRTMFEVLDNPPWRAG